MSDLHRDLRRAHQIDTVRWLFSVFAVAVTAVAAMAAYKANDTIVAKNPVSQILARLGVVLPH